MGSAPIALAAFEIAVGRRGAALPWLELVGIHAEAHRAARLAPFEPRRLENFVEALGFGLHLHESGARYDHRAQTRVNFAPADDARDRPKILDAAVGA